MTGNHIRRPSPVITKRSEWPNSPLKRDYCQGIENIPERVLTSHSDNRVGPIKLSDGPCTQSGKGVLRELNRVHFPESAGVEINLEGR